MWRLTRRIVFVKYGNVRGDFVDTDPLLPDCPPIFDVRAPPTATALATLPDPALVVGGSVGVVPEVGVPTLILGKIKTSLVLDQGGNSEVTMPGQNLIAKWEATYVKLKGALPLPEQ